jgi:hypothetical protein
MEIVKAIHSKKVAAPSVSAFKHMVILGGVA